MINIALKLASIVEVKTANTSNLSYLEEKANEWITPKEHYMVCTISLQINTLTSLHGVNSRKFLFPGIV